MSSNPANVIRAEISRLEDQISHLVGQLTGLRVALQAIDGSSSHATASASAGPVSTGFQPRGQRHVGKTPSHPARKTPSRPADETASRPAVKPTSVSETPSLEDWLDAVQKMCLVWRDSTKKGSEKRYPDGKINVVSVTNPNAWLGNDFIPYPGTKGTAHKALEENGFTVETSEDKTTYYLVFPDIEEADEAEATEEAEEA